MDFFNDMFEQGQTKLHEKKKKFRVVDLDDENLFETVEETFIEAGQGPRTSKTSNGGLADCGHYVGFQSERELQGKCSCGAKLCFRCSDVKCQRCGISPLCPKCASPIDGVVFCRKCRRIIIAQSLTFAALRRLHSLFSREID